MRINVSHQTWLRIFFLLIALVPGGDHFGSARAEIAKMTLSSPAFASGGAISQPYTCRGRDVSPPLQWSHVPALAQSLVLIMDDPDAPDPAHPKMTWVHWVVYDIPPKLSEFKAETGVIAERLAHGGTQGLNDFKKLGYGGPCPPVGTHRYFFKLYALDVKLGLAPGKSKDDIERAMAGHVLDKAELIGLAHDKHP